MKLLSRALVIAVVSMMLLSSQTQAQNVKIGHINTSDLLQIIPGRDTAQAALQSYAQSLQSDLQTYQQEFETKYTKYMETQEEMPKLMRQTREEELMEMQERIQKYQESAQQDLQNKEKELLQPILERAQNAIDEVSEEHGYTYILDTSTGAVVFVGDKGDDIMPLVKKNLGLEDVDIPEPSEQNSLPQNGIELE
ncbi:MAG: OmpH family outer membrane protein [Bacteroidales bacterium]